MRDIHVAGRHRPLVAIFLAALLTFLLPVSIDAALSVTSPVTLTAEICETCSPQVVLPITVTGAAPGDLDIEVRDVSFGDRHDATLSRAVTAAIDNKSRFPRLTLAIAHGALRAVGSYKVLLQLEDSEGNSTTLLVQLVRPPATLQLTGPVVIERVHGIPWTSGQTKPPLTLRETSKRTGLATLTLDRSSTLPGRIDVGSPSGCLNDKAVAAALALPPGGQRCLPYEVTGNFPLGTQVETQTLTAPELQAGVPVVFDIRSRLAKGYVLVYALLGLLCSLILKVALQRGLEVREARLAGLDLLDQVRADLARHPDRDFREAIKDKRRALEAAVEGPDPTTIATARAELETAWRAATAALATRRQEIHEKLDTLRTITETPWHVPQHVAQTVNDLARPLTTLRELVAADRLSEADDQAQRTTIALAAAINTAMTEWQDSTPGYLNTVAGSPVGLSPQTKSEADRVFSEARSSIGATRIGATVSLDGIVQALQGISDEYRRARSAARIVGQMLEAEVESGAAVLGTSRTTLSQLDRAVTAAKTALVDGLERPQAAGSTAAGALRTLHDAWNTALQEFAGVPLSETISQLLAQRRYVDAAADVAGALAVVANKAAGLEADAVFRASRRDLPVVLADEPRSPPLTFRTHVPPPSNPPSLRTLRAGTRREIATAKLLQSGLVALLAGLIGFGLFAPKFIGDYQDFLVIFFWAFGLDLTVDGVTKLAPRRSS